MSPVEFKERPMSCDYFFPHVDRLHVTCRFKKLKGQGPQYRCQPNNCQFDYSFLKGNITITAIDIICIVNVICNAKGLNVFMLKTSDVIYSSL